MDFNKAIGIEYRVVSEAERDGQPARIVSGARTYDTDMKDLWNAISDPDRIPRWFLPVTGELQLGGRFQLEGNAGGEILQCVPPEMLEVTWECGGTVSWVCVRLTPDGEGTRLTLEHMMLQDEQSEEHWKKYGPGATGVGWELGFVCLSLNLDHGNPMMDQQEFHAWMASEPGKEFMRQSAHAWGEAHIASNESPETARIMATQTAKAYTGEE